VEADMVIEEAIVINVKFELSGWLLLLL